MRFIYFLILMVLLAAIGLFAVQNPETITVRYLDRSVSCPLALLVGSVYLIGMMSGWTVIGMFRRSLHRISRQ